MAAALLVTTAAFAFAAEISPLRRLAISQATAAADSIVQTNYLLDPNGICTDAACTAAQLAALEQKKALLSPHVRAALARSRLWTANKLLQLDRKMLASTLNHVRLRQSVPPCVLLVVFAAFASPLHGLLINRVMIVAAMIRLVIIWTAMDPRPV